ncbi:MAG: peptide chain release factor N(5)-glutamine methyltransferase [Nitrospira sp.]|nr:peptide chain release factor N(5)-glutamine methyltransferase [Nitrospira sp.]
MSMDQLGIAASPAGSIRSALAEAQRSLHVAGIEEPALEAAWLLEHVLHLSPLMQRVQGERPVSAVDYANVQELVARRANREPLQYLLGTQEFCGREFRVTSAVLIPRPESVLLVQGTIRRCRQNPAAVVVDVGTGSGCLAVSVASALADARVLAIDASGDALAVARANMEQHGLDARIECVQGDLLAPLAERGWASQVDVVVSNPPYIADFDLVTLQPEVRCFEPRLALAGGPDGMDVHRRLLQQAPVYLKSGGVLLMEVGLGQAASVCREAEKSGWFRTYDVLRDEGGIDRVVCFEKKEERSSPLIVN